MGVLFVESIKRLFGDGKIDKKKVVELFESGRISEEEKMYIVDVDNANDVK